MKLNRLLPVLALALAAPLLFAQAAPAKSAVTATTTKAATASPNKSALLDINTASADQLAQLPGIGEAFSKRIIDGRPYTAKNQLATRGIVPKATYEGIATQIIAKRPAKAK
jgi:competence protein ComEA